MQEDQKKGKRNGKAKMKPDFWFTPSLQLERCNISKFLGTVFVGGLLPWQCSVMLSQLRLELSGHNMLHLTTHFLLL